MTVQLVVVLQEAALSVALSVLVFWIWRHPNGAARAHLLGMFGAATLWSWFVTVKDAIDPHEFGQWWVVGGIVCGVLALYSVWRCVRWMLA